MAPPFIYRVDEIAETNRHPKRHDLNGDWQPPRPLGSNALTDATSGWLYYSGQQGQGSVPLTVPEGQSAPSNLGSFKTYTMYYCDGTFWAVPMDASRKQVGDGSTADERDPDDGEDQEGDDSSDSESDESDDDDDVPPDWALLGFNQTRHLDQYTSYACTGAPRTHMILQRSDQDIWVQQLFPDRYQSQQHVQVNAQNQQYGGLVGILPILIGLVAFSAHPDHLQQVLTTCVHGNQWRTHTRTNRRGWRHKRGLVIRTYTYTRDPASTTEELIAFETGQRGKIYP